MSRQEVERNDVLEDLIDALRAFTVETDVFVDVFARAHGLGRSELNAMLWIAQGTASNEPLTAGQLSARLGLGAPATTALIDRLESAGHIRRARDQADRRKVTVWIEAQASALAVAFFAPLGERMGRAVAGVPDDDLERASAIVRRLTEAVTAARQAAAG